MAETVNWPGASGKVYQYWIHEIGASFKEEAGNYIFAKQDAGYWKTVYIGQTSNLNQRLENHEKEDCATRNGATHLHAHLNSSGEAARKAEEADLIGKWTPKCNEQLK